MKMMDAYRKAARLARKHGAAVVVIVDDDTKPRASAYDAVALAEYQADQHAGQFFDYVDEVAR
jgi:cobalamin-dependent methionine synthase I